MMQFYDDGVVQLDRAALTLRRYHFPSGTAKVIPLDQIRGYQAERDGSDRRHRRVDSESSTRQLP